VDLVDEAHHFEPHSFGMGSTIGGGHLLSTFADLRMAPGGRSSEKIAILSESIPDLNHLLIAA
jgi:hypothetical protein